MKKSDVSFHFRCSEDMVRALDAISGGKEGREHAVALCVLKYLKHPVIYDELTEKALRAPLKCDITVRLPEGTASALRSVADGAGVPVSRIIRMAVFKEGMHDGDARALQEDSE